VDTIDPARRSANMRRIRSSNTKPELAVRRVARALGYTGYRIHRKDLPGKPDLAWIGRKVAVFVHGCFWHGHDCKEGLRRPKSNQDYWLTKIENNQRRDTSHIAKLVDAGWTVVVIWECEAVNCDLIVERLQQALTG
jgi:DNA mismatch endonuclease (patch repair protein)